MYVSNKLYKEMAVLSKEKNIPITIHCAEVHADRHFELVIMDEEVFWQEAEKRGEEVVERVGWCRWLRGDGLLVRGVNFGLLGFWV